MDKTYLLAYIRLAAWLKLKRVFCYLYFTSFGAEVLSVWAFNVPFCSESFKPLYSFSQMPSAKAFLPFEIWAKTAQSVRPNVPLDIPPLSPLEPHTLSRLQKVTKTANNYQQCFLSNSGQVFLDEIASLHLPGSVCPSVCLHLLESHLSAARIYSLHCILRRTKLFHEILIRVWPKCSWAF